MKKILSLLALTIAVFTLQSNTPPTPLPIGSKLPKMDLNMETAMGKSLSMKKVIGQKGILVMFSCNECPFVIKYQQRTLQIANHAIGLGYGVILLNSNESLQIGRAHV